MSTLYAALQLGVERPSERSSLQVDSVSASEGQGQVLLQTTARTKVHAPALWQYADQQNANGNGYQARVKTRKLFSRQKQLGHLLHSDTLQTRTRQRGILDSKAEAD
jgi:hypothetical protein